MAISINPITHVIYVPKADLTLIQASPEVRELDLNSFRMELKSIEDDPDYGIFLLKTHTHNTEVTLSGLTYARIIEILAPYTIEFEDGQYAVNCIGANHNVSDVKVANSVSLIINNAAGLISNAQIEYASFNGGVTIDTNNGVSGTLFPRGTQQMPVNNIDDAYLIASNRGFPTFFIIGDLDLTVAVPDLTGYTFVGAGMDRTTIDIASDAVVDDCHYTDAHVTGTLDGNSRLDNCIIDNLVYVKGFIEQCVLAPGTIVLAGTEEAHFLDCWSGVPGISTPVIDMGGSGQALALRNYNGGIALKNKSGMDAVSIDLNSGQVILEDTVTAGDIVCRGIGKLTDNSNGANVLADDLLNYENITKVNWGLVCCDLAKGSAGTTFPLGTKAHPVNNLADAKQIAENNTINLIHLHGDFSLDSDFSGYSFESHSVDAVTLDVNGQNIDNCRFFNMTIEGACNGRAEFVDCRFPNGLSNINGHFENCILGGTITVSSGGTVEGDRCSSPATTVFNLNGDGSVGLANFSGVLAIANVTDAGSTVSLTGYYLLTLDSSCTAGVGLIAGIGIVMDSSGDNFNVTERTLPHAVWNTVLTGATYNEPNSAGRRLRQLSQAVIMEGEVVGATINTVSFNGDASSVDGAYDPSLVAITDGTGAGQSRLILEYVGATKMAVVDRDWKTIPDVTSKFVIYAHSGREHVNEGRAQGGTSNTITLNTLASSANDAYKGQVVFIRSGTGEDQVKMINGYNGTTKTATIETDWAVIPDTTSAYVIIPYHVHSDECISRAVWEGADGLDVLSKLSFINGIEGGRWQLSGSQMIFYDDDNATELARFNITYDGNQNPTERVRI